MTDEGKPVAAVLDWVRRTTRSDRVAVLAGMRDGRSPWLLQVGDRRVVLRIGASDRPDEHTTEQVALLLAARLGAPAPRLLGADHDTETGAPLTLIEYLSGSSTIPPTPSQHRLRTLGAAAARLHLVPLEPTADLPARTRPIATEDFARLRREQDDKILLRTAEERIAKLHPVSPSVLVHGDLWQGNTLWADESLVGIIDWDCAGVGPAGVDLGSLRCDAALCYGPDAARDILVGWEEHAGRAADDVAYWDVVAALATPPDLGWFPAAMAGQGRPDLTRPVLEKRRDAFLRRALHHLTT